MSTEPRDVIAAALRQPVTSMSGPGGPSELVADAILTALSSAGIDCEGWRDIESAPKDGTHVLIATAEDVVLEAYYEKDEDRGWYESGSHWTDQYDGSVCQVVAWRPLPLPPLASGGG